MALAWVETCASLGLDAPSVRVEVHLSPGLPGLTLVGLPETVVRESKDRVRSALLNSGFDFPHQRITINLSPADLPKEGGRFDLPIALGILAASGQIPAAALDALICIGELALSGDLLPVTAILPASLAARARGRTLVTAIGNAAEAALPGGARVLAAHTLSEVVQHVRGHSLLSVAEAVMPVQLPDTNGPDLAEVRGQHLARRGLEIAAAGGHSLLFCGPPGSGKTLMASRLPGLLPALTPLQQIEVAALHSLAGTGRPLQALPPYRAPHHKTPAAALIGGGSGIPRPGDISLAHHGVLFLDELPEFHRDVLEALREPLESREIVIARTRHRLRYPAHFQLVTAMNPCPCGRSGTGDCRCTPEQVARYRGRVSGPLLDRIDLHVSVEAVALSQLQAGAPAGESSAAVRNRVLAARARQSERQEGLNAALSGDWLANQLSASAANLLQAAAHRLQLSARSYHRVLRVARTLADLAGRDDIGNDMISEALVFRARS